MPIKYSALIYNREAQDCQEKAPKTDDIKSTHFWSIRVGTSLVTHLLTPPDADIAPTAPMPADHPTFQLGDWLLVELLEYDETEYPGELVQLNPSDNGELQVSVMHKAVANRFKWPSKPDILWYPPSHVIRSLQFPNPVGSRGQYTFPDL